MSEQRTVPLEVFEEVMKAYRSRLMTTCSVGTSSVYEKHKHYLAPPEPKSLEELKEEQSIDESTMQKIYSIGVYTCNDDSERFAYRDLHTCVIWDRYNDEVIAIYDRRK